MKKMSSPATAGKEGSNSAAKASRSDQTAGQAKNGAKVKEVNLEHMPQFIKNAPWYMN